MRANPAGRRSSHGQAHTLRPAHPLRPRRSPKVRTMNTPLMPKATAVWLIEKTGLTFEQIGAFCGMHHLEVQAIADGEVAQGIVGYDPVANMQVTAEEIRRAEADPAYRLRLLSSTLPTPKRLRGARYTPVAKRNDRPNGIAYLLRNFPQLEVNDVAKLMGTTKETVTKVRDRTHWNAANIKPQDPVILGLCSQTDLNNAVGRASERRTKRGEAVPVPPPVAVEDEAA